MAIFHRVSRFPHGFSTFLLPGTALLHNRTTRIALWRPSAVEHREVALGMPSSAFHEASGDIQIWYNYIYNYVYNYVYIYMYIYNIYIYMYVYSYEIIWMRETSSFWMVRHRGISKDSNPGIRKIFSETGGPAACLVSMRPAKNMTISISKGLPWLIMVIMGL